MLQSTIETDEKGRQWCRSSARLMRTTYKSICIPKLSLSFVSDPLDPRSRPQSMSDVFCECFSFLRFGNSLRTAPSSWEASCHKDSQSILPIFERKGNREEKKLSGLGGGERAQRRIINFHSTRSEFYSFVRPIFIVFLSSRSPSHAQNTLVKWLRSW